MILHSCSPKIKKKYYILFRYFVAGSLCLASLPSIGQQEKSTPSQEASVGKPPYPASQPRPPTLPPSEPTPTPQPLAAYDRREQSFATGGAFSA